MPNPEKSEAEILQDKVRQTISEIRDVLLTHLPDFFEAEIKRRFVAAGEFADRLTDERLTELKTEVKAQSQKFATEIAAFLNDESRWWVAPPTEGDKKHLGDNEAIWNAVKGVETRVVAFLQRFGFPLLPGETEYTVRYRLPAMFIHGKYLPGLCETYWNRLHQWFATKQQKDQQSAEAKRQVRAERWEKT